MLAAGARWGEGGQSPYLSEQLKCCRHHIAHRDAREGLGPKLVHEKWIAPWRIPSTIEIIELGISLVVTCDDDGAKDTH